MAVRALPMARALAARGHVVTLLLPPWQNPEDAGRKWQEENLTVENILLPVRAPLLFHVLVGLRLARRALALCPDVVHLFKPKAYSGLSHWLLAHWPAPHRPPVVVDADDWEGAGGWNEVVDPLTGRRLYSGLQRGFFAWQERWGLTHADAVTVASRTLESLVWALGVPPHRVFYVPNGVADAWLAASGGSPPPVQPTVLLYTRFWEFPVARVIQVLSLVRRRVPQARLLVVGEGLFGEQALLLHEAERAGLLGAIEYIGWVDPANLPEYFGRATLALYPFDDTLINRAKCPVKLLDLMACGVPVVAEAVGEIAEIIRHGQSGWLVRPGDVEGLAQAAARLLENQPLRARLARGGIREVRSRRSWDRLVETVERAYRLATRA